MRKVIFGAGIIGAGTVSAALIVQRRQRRRIRHDVDGLFATMEDEQPLVVTEDDLVGLPEPVERWLRCSGIVGTIRPRAIRLRQRGEFRLEGRRWMPFEAEEYFTTNPPGFVWAVRMQMFPLVSVSGRDQYRDGEGALTMRLLSMLPVANKSGGDLNQGALLRFLNEMMWFPAAVLSPYIDWEERDAGSAVATMSWGGVTAQAAFFFDSGGRLTNMVAERYNDTRDGFETWSTPLSTYAVFDGIRVPVAGEGVWKYAAEDFPYIRLHITHLEYDVPKRF